MPARGRHACLSLNFAGRVRIVERVGDVSARVCGGPLPIGAVYDAVFHQLYLRHQLIRPHHLPLVTPDRVPTTGRSGGSLQARVHAHSQSTRGLRMSPCAYLSPASWRERGRRERAAARGRDTARLSPVSVHTLHLARAPSLRAPPLPHPSSHPHAQPPREKEARACVRVRGQ